MWLAGSSLLAGCTSPPSVVPLLEASQRALRQEVQLLTDDQTRDRQQVTEARAALAAAFEADLRQTPQPTPQWIREAAEVYAAARESLAQHELKLEGQRQRRVDNLETAIQAQQRAVELLQRQDQLWTQVTGLDLWRLQRVQPSSKSATP